MPTAASPKRVCVIVLGDLGRSPRMCNHAVSLANQGFNVRLIGYPGSNVPTGVRSNANVSIIHMKPFPLPRTGSIPQVVVFALKVIWQSLMLCMALPLFFAPHVILLQNPPTIPCLPVCYFYSKLLGSKLVIDWHNYGHSILAMSLAENHPLLKLAKGIERFFGPLADGAFCVTDAMRNDLEQNWQGTKALTLYDRAPDHFKPISIIEKHELLSKLAVDYNELGSNDDAFGTALTEQFSRTRIELREDRPGLLVSSTSWTPDEDFSILFEALNAYNIACQEGLRPLPKLVCVITGKGPMKEYYQTLIKAQNWRFVQVIMPWLEPEDYPKILATADLGVCLHTSSSGLDLPMKVVDMFGCGLPVCAFAFPALPELVLHDYNGLVFTDSEELAHQIISWFQGFPNDGSERRAKFKNNLVQFQSLRWDNYWKMKALPLFKQLSS
ncbi:hypothetical protein TCAL_08693 [Tigriopus californicus]|uniref:Uncharacterized protein n=1 Tax=Tigriopus californicus TaxID=6832 RepID=A0A553NB09_TIGCA|nr:chitobiosyldiphosphodolichol beta-mannosyltransferase-like [Tigriopus californicus]TRY62632.1 hypothetical protein TCAL_08693 [Tigriopus californicus]|eukprot:TCALIF_08693-PA protein Name:"Similar to ALG1 Chitobiosyldiphosphodolichol beta-mannosyltransferase (Pongo abelii)" AED:0.27 eAED:0.27 QI:0/-1/0/1/-1/1/1/0/440